MRFEPFEISAKEKKQQEKITAQITEKVAIGFAAVTVFIFFFKLLFF